MTSIRWWLALAMALLLGGCVSPPPRLQAPDRLFADALFKPPARAIDVREVFALSEPMQRYLREQIEPLVRRRGAEQALFDALYAQGQLKLDYDSTRTRTASEAFDARSGNCMSLVVMTGAFAQALGLQVHYQSVVIDEVWSRSDDLYFAIGHVNIRLGRAKPGWDTSWMTIDFQPGQDPSRQHVKVIDEARVLAMFMNNRAAEALSHGDLDEAYAWVREAARQDPQYAAVYNTLGVVYLRRGALAEAETALRAVRSVEPRNPHALGNLVQALLRQGRQAEALPLQAELARLQPTPPFAGFEQGRQAMRAGDYRRARDLFEAEVARSPHYHEFHFWLALAHLQLGQTRDASEHLRAAMENSTTPAQHAIYAGKLQRLKAVVQ